MGCKMQLDPCKGCGPCPEPTPEMEDCKPWCSPNPSPWDTKCKLDACKGCEPCPKPTPQRADCKPWCSPNPSPWDTKCKLDACKGCEPCPEPTPQRADCKPWCSPNPSPWDQKCKLDACKGCEPCPEPTPSQATPPPTFAADTFPPAPPACSTSTDDSKCNGSVVDFQSSRCCGVAGLDVRCMDGYEPVHTGTCTGGYFGTLTRFTCKPTCQGDSAQKATAPEPTPAP